MEATFPLEDDRNRDKRSDAPQASGSRASPLSLCSWRTANGAIAMATKEASAGPSFGDSYAYALSRRAAGGRTTAWPG